MNCRFDGQPLTHVFADLGFSPPSNALLAPEQLLCPEVHYPLKLYVSERSFLVQVDEVKKADEIFSGDYVYFSSFSSSWLKHCQNYVNQVTPRLGLSNTSQVIETASNDGYLLQYFKEKDIPVLGIEPTSNTAKEAEKKGIKTITKFFGESLATDLANQGTKADLLIGNNVLAHVPDINDFVKGLKVLLAENGVITMEFPHLMKLVEEKQFDTIYHEHFSYLSFYTVKHIFDHHGLELFDVEQLPTHGGSLRIYAKHKENTSWQIEASVQELLNLEEKKGLQTVQYYQGFQKEINSIKYAFLSFLIEQKKTGKKVLGYGAAAKGNTLLNYCGITADLIAGIADKSPHKQGKILPANHIPVISPQELLSQKPDYVVIFPWNIQTEIMGELAVIKDWGGKFVVAIPELIII